MENPCYLNESEAGELRRWRSLPPDKTSSVSTIYRPEVYTTVPPRSLHKTCQGGWRLDILPSASRPHTTLLSALLLATLITLAATAALVCLLRAVHTRYTPAAVVPNTWTAEMVISGEFRITNEPYNPSLDNVTTTHFKQLAAAIGKQLNRLFRESLMSDHYKSGQVVSFSPGLTVHCSLILHPTDPLTVSKVGLAFLGGLRHSHGHLWLGPYMVDVQSIGFQASTEEATWSQWSSWSECLPASSNQGKMIRKRKRFCLSLTGADMNRINPCQVGSLQGVNDTETEACFGQILQAVNRTRDTKTHEQNSTTTPRAEKLVTALHDFENSVDDNNSTSSSGALRTCLDCLSHEVCVALEGELVPYCRFLVDPSDPTGCGGLCKINTEVCYRLREGAYRCVDDSKCLDDEWQCGNKLCIPSVKRCDGHFNCYDHTDEYNCDCDLKTHFHCGKNSSCLPKSKKCDGIVNCWDAADEVNCTIGMDGASLDETSAMDWTTAVMDQMN